VTPYFFPGTEDGNHNVIEVFNPKMSFIMHRF